MATERAERSGVRIPEEERHFYPFQNAHTDFGAILASCPVLTGVFSEGWSGQGVKFIIHLHLARG